MDADASERRKIKIYAGQKKKKRYEEISPMAYAQLECCDGGFGAEKFLFANYVFVNNKYVQGEKKLTCQMNPTWKL